MQNFIMREMTITSKDENGIYAVRTRTSKGFSSISIHFGGQKIVFDNEDGNDQYEQQAFEVSKILNEIAMQKCDLPKIEQ